MIKSLKNLAICKGLWEIWYLNRFKNRHRSKELYRSQVEGHQREMAKRNRELIHRIHEVDSLKTRYEEAYASMEQPIGTLGTASSKVNFF